MEAGGTHYVNTGKRERGSTPSATDLMDEGSAHCAEADEQIILVFWLKYVIHGS